MIRKLKITPFLIASLLLLIYSIKSHLFDFWTLDGGASLIGIFAIGGLLLAILFYFLNKHLVKRVKLRSVYIIEISALFIMLTMYYFYNRRIVFQANPTVDFFALVYEVTGHPKLENSFLFDKLLKVTNNGAYLTSSKDRFRNMPKIIGRNYKSISSIPLDLIADDKGYKVDLIVIDNVKVNRDSLKIQIVKLINNISK